MKSFWLLIFFLVSLNSYCVTSADTPPSARSPLNFSTGVSEHQEKLQLKADDSTASELAIRVLLSMAVAITLVVGILALLRRYIPAFQSGITGKVGKRVRLLEVTRLTPKLTLYLVSMDVDRYFIAQLGDNLIVLDKKSEQPRPVTSDMIDD